MRAIRVLRAAMWRERWAGLLLLFYAALSYLLTRVTSEHGLFTPDRLPSATVVVLVAAYFVARFAAFFLVLPLLILRVFWRSAP